MPRLKIEGIEPATTPFSCTYIATDAYQALALLAATESAGRHITHIYYDDVKIDVREYKLAFLLLP